MPLLLNFVDLFMESAPWLLLGFLIAGLIKTWIPQDFLTRHLGNGGVKSTIKAALLGAPLPLCSCGVIPASMGLRKGGASKAATTSFLISTPETGVDSISISYALLGPFMAIIRPIAAISSAICAGILVGQDSDSGEISKTPSNCCSKEPNTKKHTSNQWLDGIKFTFIDLVDDIAKWLIIGLILAAMIKTWVPNDVLIQWGSGFMAFSVMALIGVPMYICATASTPIAASFLLSGVSPGAVLVFMLVGPATNMATLGVVKNELGKRALYAYLGSVVGVGFIFGYLTNYLVTKWEINLVAQTEHIHNLLPSLVTDTCSIILALLIIFSFVKKMSMKKAHSH